MKGKDAWEIGLLLYYSEKDGAATLPRSRELFESILSDYWSGYIVVTSTRRHEPWVSVIENVRDLAKKIAEFPAVGGDGSLQVQSGYQDIRMLERVLHGIAWGPPLEIYRF